MVCNHIIRRDMSKYEAVYFVGDNQAINRVRVDSSKTRNQGAFSGSLATLVLSTVAKVITKLVNHRYFLLLPIVDGRLDVCSINRR